MLTVKNSGIKKRIKGMSIIEVIIALVVITCGILTALTVIAASLRFSTQSRQQVYAYLVAESMLEKIKAHKYGEPAPKSWKEPEYYKISIEGKAEPMLAEFKRDYNFTAAGANGSFVDSTMPQTEDIVTIVVTWVEGTGRTSAKSKKIELETKVKKSEVEVK
ncbi:MAG: hypothetical protein K8T10_17670 [Candidatus Eremiobacteraeota bacterium]|nr:hypothetical protein [Candidatus Eremiobacteraeota bacterium]